ncbi:helix-turn-helix domain-containing protein [Clostridium sp. CS001]|uniref:PucR family transcriptional regulator n=1 Tax=Clostridium sp. CS001 TaxID=2880648 RepID=UPI001CF1AF08|nr:helix-turn-helix domain-containing protein [Clostridium sp. CS001]MCB2291842.1 helix-turn-helix domain-containing protein [Clostridium sp. CS001]
MKITFYDIYKYFKDRIILNNLNESTELIQMLEAKLLVKNQKIFKSNFIYVGTTSFIIKNQINLQSANAILIDDTFGNIPAYNLGRSKYLILESNCELFETFNAINELFTENSLLNALKSCIALENIAEVASQALDNPIIIIDPSYRILASSEISKISDKFWIQNVKNGYCSYDFISYVRNMESIKNSLNNITPFKVICDKSHIERWVTKIIVDGKLIGYIITLLSNSPMEENYKNILLMISNVISDKFEKNLANRNMDNFDRENFLVDLLDEKIKDYNALKEKLKTYGLNYKSNFIVIVLDIDKFDALNKTPNYISDKLEKLFHKKTHTYYENYIVMLYDYKSEPFISAEQKQLIENFANENQILIGISNTFRNLINSRKYFEQGISSIKISEKVNIIKTINYYKNIQAYDFINKASHTIEMESFIHPSLNILRDYDEENNTELYKTLYLYLKNNHNSVFAAKELFIHRNTVKYRLDKILELTDINLKNEDEVFQVFFSYKCLQCNGVSTRK